MMLLDKRNAFRIFYYLLAIDGSIEEAELAQLDVIGAELDGEAFEAYKETLLAECAKTVPAGSGAEYYDILSEQVDKACSEVLSYGDDGVPSSLLIWDMLVIAYANHEYDDSEKRLIHHVARVFGLDNSVLQEMESHIQTIAAIEKQLEEYQGSTMPYAEIRPIVDELENRKNTILECVTELISDELYESVGTYEDIVDKAKAFYAEKAAPVLQKAGEEAEKAWEDLKEKSAPAIEKSKETLGMAWVGLKAKAKYVMDTKGKGKGQE